MAGEDDRDFSQLSDDEIMGLGASDIARIAGAEQAQTEQVTETEEEHEAVEPQGNHEVTKAEGGDDEDEGNPEVELPEETEEERLARETEEEADLDEEELAELRTNREAAREKVEEPAKPVGKKDKEPAVESFDADGAKKLFEPFKANGRTMSIRNADEGVRLMQLGAGYNAKMEELKPKLAIVRTLEREGLLDADKLSFLIDLHKKNPEAIGKLLKDSGIDPLDLDSDKVAGYKPNTYAVSDKQMNLDEVLDDLKDNEHFKPVIHAVANEWDKASQEEVAAEPQVLRVLAKHKEIGVYDTITNEVERRRALGQLNGVPALKAYSLVGDEFEAAGKFAHLAPKPAPAAALPVTKTVAAKPAKAAESQAVIDKRKAAATTASAPAVKAGLDPEFNPLSMSDEDFAKFKLPV